MRELLVSIDGKHYRGSWDTWQDNEWGRMIEVTYRDASMARFPVGEESPASAAERALRWLIQEAIFSR